MPKFSYEYLLGLSTEIFKAAGFKGEDASVVANHLVENNLMGLDSHGVIRIVMYMRLLSKGTMKPDAKLRIIKDNGATVMLDCDYSVGQVGGEKAVKIAIERAKQYGISCVVTQNCNHVGRLGYYTETIARAGMIGLAACSTPCFGHMVAPFGGREGRLATNPFSFAAASNGDPIVLDMSTSAVSEGKVRVCLNKNEQLPKGLILDAEGKETTDPKDFYGPPMGAILPFGGNLGYKGTALGIMVEILGSTLAGNLIDDKKLIGNGLCIIAIDVSNFVETNRFRQLIDQLIDYIKSSPAVEGNDEVLVPGELDFKRKEERLKNGIEIDDTTWQQITEAANKSGIEIEQNRLNRKD